MADGAVRAPEFPRDLVWLRPRQPRPLASFRGRFVLFDFWTFCCINCLHVLRELEDLEERYAEVLSVVGILSPKFPEEADPRKGCVPHDFLKELPISDSEGSIVTDTTMRHPRYRNVLAAGNTAAISVPKLGGIGHAEADIVGKQIALDVGQMDPERANEPLKPVVYCIGDMGDNLAFYIRSNSWFGGPDQLLKMGRIPFLLKMQYKNLFFRYRGKIPEWGLDASQFLAEKLFAT